MMQKNTAFSGDTWFAAALRTVFDVSFFLYGLYFEMGPAIISAYLLIILILKSRDGLRIKLNAASAAVGVMALFYFVSAFRAVDPWLALRGAVKFLPVLLFTLCLMQEEQGSRLRMLRDVPAIGAVMTVVAYFLGLFPVFSVTIWWRGRFAGLFLYPNVYACFLLLGLEILLTTEWEEGKRWRELACGCILFFGLLQSGSRLVFLLAVPGVIAALLIRRNSRSALAAAGSLTAGYGINLLTVRFTGHDSSGRVLQVSTRSSSLRSRLLYWKDALPVALTHPFGFGYHGYTYLEGSVQTGSYSVMAVHNSFLQIMLDIGWIPAALAFAAVMRGFFSRHATAVSRLLLTTLILHSVMDFDLEFTAMYFILMCLLDLDTGREVTLRIPLPVEVVPALLIGAFCFYVGTACLFLHNGDYRTAFRVCPWDTESEAVIMDRTADVTEKRKLAEDILSRNQYVAPAWNVLAQAAQSEGDLESYIAYTKKAISLARYRTEWYVDYFYGLEGFYEEAFAEGDAEEMALCLAGIREIGVILEELAEKTDSLASGESTVPESVMPERYYEFLKEHADNNVLNKD